MRGRQLIRSAAREPRAYPRTSGPQREFLPKIGNLGQHFLQVKIIRIAPLRNSPRQNADFQRVAAEGIGLERRAIVSFGLQIPIHFLALVVGRNGVDGGAFQWPEAKVKGEAVQGFETLRVDLQPFFVGKIFCRGISAKVHFQPQFTTRSIPRW